MTFTASYGVTFVVSCVTALTPDFPALRWRWIGLTLSMVALLAVACSSDGSDELLTALEPLTPEQVVSRSSEAMSGMSTFRFSLSHDQGNTVLTNGIEVQKASGTATIPDSYTLDADTLVSGFFVNSQGVVIGDDSYMTHPITRGWQLLEPEASPFRTFDPVSLVGSILGQVVEITSTPASEIAGGTYAIDGKLPAIALTTLTGGVDETAPPLAVRVTIDGTSLFPVEARIVGRATAEEPDDLVRTVRLFAFNSDITIAPPL